MFINIMEGEVKGVGREGFEVFYKNVGRGFYLKSPEKKNDRERLFL